MVFAESGLMGKILFMLLIAAITWVLFKKRARPPPAHKTKDQATANPVTDSDSAVSGKQADHLGSPERMVACAACGVFMPESDSVILHGQVSCRAPEQCAHYFHSSQHPHRSDGSRPGAGKN